MNPHKQLTPYGLWQSLITPELIGQGIRYSDVQWAPESGERLVWCQSQGGKATLMTTSAGEPASAFSGSFDPAGGVGYGGGEFCAGRLGAVFADRDGRLYFAPYGFGAIRPLTPGFGSCASPVLSPNASGVAFVHTYKGAMYWLIRARRGKPGLRSWLLARIFTCNQAGASTARR